MFKLFKIIPLNISFYRKTPWYFMKINILRKIFMFGYVKLFSFILIFICAIFVILWGVYCPVSVCFSRHNIYKEYKNDYSESSLNSRPHSYLSNKIDEYQENDIRSKVNLDFDKEDVLVFLHIQKTGGTLFEKHLVKLGLQNNPCICTKSRKKCKCRNKRGNIWLFSRYSTGWSCGLHADWTELRNCVERQLDRREGRKRKRRFYYFSVLRNPVDRYISEWKHVQRGATWSGARLVCNGRSPSESEWPLCYKGDDWSGVPLQDFMACPFNLAANRQTRMLANLSLVHCYNLTALSPQKRSEILLDSAKENLKNMVYGGIADHIIYSQYLFHRIFNLTFKEIFTVHNVTHSRLAQVTSNERDEIRRTNRLDLELYDFALQLFYKRLRYNIELDPDISTEIKTKLSGNDNLGTSSDPDFFAKVEPWLTKELIRVMMLDGSRKPDADVLNKRNRRWKKKLTREMADYEDIDKQH